MIEFKHLFFFCVQFFFFAFSIRRLKYVQSAIKTKKVTTIKPKISNNSKISFTLFTS